MDRDIRIGVLVPAGNSIHEREFAALRPSGVAFRFAGFGYPPADAADFCADLTTRMAEPIQALREWGAQLLLIGCTAASMRSRSTDGAISGGSGSGSGTLRSCASGSGPG